MKKQFILWKKYIGFVVAVMVGVLLYEHALSSGLMYYEGADNVVNAMVLSMGAGRAGWNGVLFPVIACVPMATLYVREYKSGCLWLVMEREGALRYKRRVMGENAILGALALTVPYAAYACQLVVKLGTDAPLHPEHGDTPVAYQMGLAEKSPIGYLVMTAVVVAVCGAVFATFGLGISAVVRNEFLTLLIPFALCILVAMITPFFQWDLLCTFCPNAYTKTRTSNIVIMDAVLAIAGIAMFMYGTKANEDKIGNGKER